MTEQELAELRIKIKEADAAYHTVMLGGGVAATTDQNGEKVEFTRANAPNLYKYIVYLRSQLPVDERPTYSGPIGFLFNG